MPGSSIQLQVTGDVSGSWKLTWQDPLRLWPERHYHVDAQLLEDTGKAVRAALQGLVDAAGDSQPLGPPMKQLAAAGAELRKAIFLAEGDGQTAAIQIRDRRLPLSDSLLISLDQRVYVPWGLAYDGDPEDLPDNPAEEDFKPELYGGFWCLKYRVCTLHEIVDASGVQKPRTNDEVQMLTMVNKDAWDAAHKEIPPADLQLFTSSLARSEPPITSSSEFFKTYKKLYRGVDLLYVYCHANGTKLALAGNDEISVTKFKLNVYYEDREPHPPCLVFLNGCQTAIGSEKGGFMKATGGPGFCGFIGTEAKVPDLFAMRFAARFFASLLYEQLTVAEVMDTLRRAHWPLGLVYSTCCHPLFQIRRITPQPGSSPQGNISTQQLKAERML